MKKGEIKLNKWHFKFGIIPIFWKRNGYMFHFGIFKLTNFPLEGMAISEANYKGFWLRKEIQWQGFEISF